MKVDIYMPVYIGDLLADTSHLTNEEFGAYMRLLFHQWRRGHIPERDFLQVSRISGDASSIAVARLKQFFETDEAGDFFNGRCDREKTRSLENRATYVERAKKAAAARWNAKRGKPSQGADSGDASSIGRASLEQCPSPSPVSTTPPPLRSGGGAARSAGHPSTGKSREAAGEARRASKGDTDVSTQSRASTGPAKASSAVVTKDRFASTKAVLMEWSAELTGVGIDRVAWGPNEDRELRVALKREAHLDATSMRRRLVNRYAAVEISEKNPNSKGAVGRHEELTKVIKQLPMYESGPVNAFGTPLKNSV